MVDLEMSISFICIQYKTTFGGTFSAINSHYNSVLVYNVPHNCEVKYQHWSV